MNPEEEREHARDLTEMIAAYNATLNAVVAESQHWRGEQEDTGRLAACDDAFQRAAARRRDRQRREHDSP